MDNDGAGGDILQAYFAIPKISRWYVTMVVILAFLSVARIKNSNDYFLLAFGICGDLANLLQLSTGLLQASSISLHFVRSF